MNRKSKKFYRITTMALLVSLLFFCRGASLAMTTAHDGMAMAQGGAQSTQMMPCCDIASPSAGMAHDMAIMGVSMSEFLVLLIASLMVLFNRLISRLDIKLTGGGYYYLKKIRDRYGSVHCFNTLTRLFRSGILHPKIW
jgi:hypothetical protein